MNTGCAREAVFEIDFKRLSEIEENIIHTCDYGIIRRIVHKQHQSNIPQYLAFKAVKTIVRILDPYPDFRCAYIELSSRLRLLSGCTHPH